MLLLLRVVSSMFRSDSAVFGLPRSCPWRWMIWCHLIFSDLSHIWCHTRAYSVSGEIYKSSGNCMLIPTCDMYIEMIDWFTILWWSLSGASVEPLWCHSVRPTFLGIWLPSCFLSWEMFPSCLDLIWITEFTCSMIDDSMSPGFWPTVPSTPYWGIFLSWTRFIDLHGVTWSLPLVRCTPRWGRVCYLIMISQENLS